MIISTVSVSANVISHVSAFVQAPVKPSVHNPKVVSMPPVPSSHNPVMPPVPSSHNPKVVMPLAPSTHNFRVMNMPAVPSSHNPAKPPVPSSYQPMVVCPDQGTKTTTFRQKGKGYFLVTSNGKLVSYSSTGVNKSYVCIQHAYDSLTA